MINPKTFCVSYDNAKRFISSNCSSNATVVEENVVNPLGYRPQIGSKTSFEYKSQQFPSDSFQKWDERFPKTRARYPNCTNKKTQESLWIDERQRSIRVNAGFNGRPPDLPKEGAITWNKVIAQLVKDGHAKDALSHFQEMQQHGVTPDKYTFIAVLKAWTALGRLSKGQSVHAQIIKHGFESDLFVASCLIFMYGKCGKIQNALRVFNNLPAQDVVCWSAAIAALVKCDRGDQALELFIQMQQEGLEPDNITLVAALNACTRVSSLIMGRHVHALVIQKRCQSEVMVGSCLIDMYAKCGMIEDARRVFNTMSARNVVSWNAMIAGYVKCAQGKMALRLFEQMQQELEPDSVTFVSVLNACARLSMLEKGRSVHAQLNRSQYHQDVFVQNCLMDMYMKCGYIEDASDVFIRLHTLDVVSWNTMIVGYGKCGQGEKALQLFRLMQKEGLEPNRVTFVGVLNACASVLALEEGKHIHNLAIETKYHTDQIVRSCLLDMYFKCGSVGDASKVFDHMVKVDVVSWNTMIAGYGREGQGAKALEIYQQMQKQGVKPDRVTFVAVLNVCADLAALEEGRSAHWQAIQHGFETDVVVGSSLVNMYSKCGSVEDAFQVFTNMSTRDVVCWNAMIVGYAKCGQGDKALELFENMQEENIKPTSSTFVSILNACASMAALNEGKRVHSQVTTRGFDSEIVVANCLIDMYSKCGSISEACKVFDGMITHDVFSWNAILGGFALHGHAKEALQTFEKLSQDGGEMNTITFICLLSACSHGGLVDQGLHCFESLSPIYAISVTMEHRSCLVDLLSRAGCLDEAKAELENFLCQPSVSAGMALLGACRIYENLELGKQIALKLL